ncbi:MAG TPA: hypothetical protein VEJ84_18715 [Acidimicrobiales bacterium]|nr:hypothetical protein [Acidimicrobiales bacterium]
MSATEVVPIVRLWAVPVVKVIVTGLLVGTVMHAFCADVGTWPVDQLRGTLHDPPAGLAQEIWHTPGVVAATAEGTPTPPVTPTVMLPINAMAKADRFSVQIGRFSVQSGRRQTRPAHAPAPKWPRAPGGFIAAPPVLSSQSNDD